MPVVGRYWGSRAQCSSRQCLKVPGPCKPSARLMASCRPCTHTPSRQSAASYSLCVCFHLAPLPRAGLNVLLLLCAAAGPCSATGSSSVIPTATQSNQCLYPGFPVGGTAPSSPTHFRSLFALLHPKEPTKSSSYLKDAAPVPWHMVEPFPPVPSSHAGS